MSGLERHGSRAHHVERTVQNLISSLADDELGAIEPEAPPSVRRPRDESMVVMPFDQHPDHQTVISDGVVNDGIRLRLIEHSLVPSSPLIRARMRMDDASVSMLEQLGTLDDQPLFVRVSYHLPEQFTPISQLWRDAAFEPFEVGTSEAFRRHFGVELGHTESSVEAVRSDNRTATSLRVSVGSPMMLREMVLTGVDGVVRELSFTHFRADRVALHD